MLDVEILKRHNIDAEDLENIVRHILGETECVGCQVAMALEVAAALIFFHTESEQETSNCIEYVRGRVSELITMQEARDAIKH